MTSIGFVGAGVIAWAHAIGLQAMTEAGLVEATVGVVYDVDTERAQTFAAANRAAVASSVGELLDSCDLVWICTPTAAHRSVVEQALERRTPLFCEKPLATDLEGALAMELAVSNEAVPAQVGLVLRHAPVFGALRDLIGSGDLGAPMAAILRDDQYFPIHGHYNSTWRGDVSVAGGGCLVEHSIHDVDILRFCLGEVVEVWGRTANFAGYDGIEDLATVHLAFESGASAAVVSLWHDILSRGSTRRLEVFCRRGMVWLDDDFTGPLHVETNQGALTLPCPPPDWVRDLPLGDDEVGLAIRRYVEADRDFLDSVSSGETPRPGFPEAVSAHRVVDAAYRSAAAGGTPIAPAG